VVVGIRHIQPPGGVGKPARLVKESLGEAAVPVPAGRLPGQCAHFPAGGVNPLDLAVVRVRHVQRAVPIHHAQRMLKQRGVAHTIPIAKVKQPCSRDGAHAASRVDVRRADGAGFAIGKVQHRAV